MSNEGFFRLGLSDVSGRPVNESKVKVGSVRVADNKTILSAANLDFPPSRRRRTSSARCRRSVTARAAPASSR